jgi:TIR domain-containing protein/PBS lyase HEAT-like repeat-containing protein
LQPGRNWKDSIRRAIISGSHFIWCNSDASISKSRSYANDELNLAIDELRMRSTDQAWFVPVKLTDAVLPDREIGGGRRLSDLQWVDLAADWYTGVRRVAQLVAPLPPKQRTLISLLESPNSRERASAAERIYEAPDPRLVIPLCELIRRAGRSDTEAVYWAGLALERIRDARAVPVLIEALLRGVGYEYKLVENLESFGTEESSRFLAEYRSTDDHSFERILWLMREAERRGLEQD